MASFGFTLFPIQPGTKKPVQSQHTYPYDPDFKLDHRYDAYGVLIPDEFVVYDIDGKNVREGMPHPHQTLMRELGYDPEYWFPTLTVKTRNDHGHQPGGFHIYFRKPADWPVRVHLESTQGKKYANCLEFLTARKYVIGPGSRHANTNHQIEIVSAEGVDIIPAPQKLLDKIRRIEIPDETDQVDQYYDDDPTRLEYIRFLSKVDGAIEGVNGEPHTWGVLVEGRDLGLPMEDTLELVEKYFNHKCAPPWPLSELRAKAENVYNYAKKPAGNKHPASKFSVVPVEPEDEERLRQKMAQDMDISTKKAGIEWDMRSLSKGEYVYVDTLRNVENFFCAPHYGDWQNPFYELLEFDTFSKRATFSRKAPWHPRNSKKPKYWVDSDTRLFRSWLSRHHRFNPSVRNIEDAVLNMAYRNEYHAVRRYLANLRWDGQKRLHLLFPWYAHTAKNAYTQEAGICFAVSCVARAFAPGCKVDHMPVLEGTQGTFKSTFCQSFSGPEFYKSMSLSSNYRDMVTQMESAWIIELAEMDHTDRRDVEAQKAFISRETDVIVRKYDKHSSEVPRSCTFIGTKNPTGDGRWLMDQSGNRRYWPMTVYGRCRVDDLDRDRDQLWAEAVYYYFHETPWHLTDPEAIEIAAREQLVRTTRDSWTDIIYQWISRKFELAGPDPEYLDVTIPQIYRECLNIKANNVNQNTQKRVAQGLLDIGFSRLRRQIDQQRVTVYRMYREVL